ncbi:MAG: phosphatidate cytidylyltransferase [Bacteroidia bacterium]
MKSKFILALLCSFLVPVLSSCAIVGGIFKAGVWSGIFIVVLVIALIIFLITRAGKK